jgi:hypothetical protein
MSKHKGKKVLCFIALPHHNRFLVPIMDALRSHGLEIVYFTAAAEGAFEITLNQANLPYRHLLDYCDSKTAKKIDAAYHYLRPIYQEKILSSEIFQAVPVVIQDKTIRPAVENFYCLMRMFEVEDPALVFALHELNPWGKMIGYLSHVYRVPYFTLQEGLYYADVHYYRFHTDFSTACFVWGEDCRQILRRAGCGDDKIYPVGNTHIWQAKTEAASAAAIKETRAHLNVGAEKKLVLFLMSHSHYQPFDMRVFFKWMQSRGDVVAVFKWHPVTGRDIIERALEHAPGTAPIIKTAGLDTYRLIAASDICVAVGNTTTGLESIAFGKPLIECRLPDQTYSFADQGVAETALGFEDLGEKCESILENGLSVERQEQVEKYLSYNFAYRDEKTLDRILRLAFESLETRSRPAPEALTGTASVNAECRCSIILPVCDLPPAVLITTLTSIADNTPASLYEVIVVDCSTDPEVRRVLVDLGGDVQYISGATEWTYAKACNRAAETARGEYVVFVKPGIVMFPQWLGSLLELAASDSNAGVVSGLTLNENGLVCHVGIAFDVNQSPFYLYRFLPPEFSGVRRFRTFRAVETPFLTTRSLFCRLGGFSTEFSNRFEDIDFCMRVTASENLKILYTPRSVVKREYLTWSATEDVDTFNRIRFYSKWTGHLWQDDEQYLREDGLTHDDLTRMYKELAARIIHGTTQLQSA